MAVYQFLNAEGYSVKKLLEKYDLEITAEGNQKLLNYLDVTLNLKEGTFTTYHKPGEQIQHIYRKPINPPNVIKYISVSIENRL